MDNDLKKKINLENKKFLDSFKYAGTGIISCLKIERNIKIHILAMVLVIIFGLIFEISSFEWMVCMILFAGVISAEMFNTAIEKISDFVMPEKSDKIKVIKDVSAGAVLVWATFSAIIGLIIFIPKIF